MKLLLDTHAFMWWHSEPECIPKDTLTVLLFGDCHLEIIAIAFFGENI